MIPSRSFFHFALNAAITCLCQRPVIWNILSRTLECCGDVMFCRRINFYSCLQFARKEMTGFQVWKLSCAPVRLILALSITKPQAQGCIFLCWKNRKVGVGVVLHIRVLLLHVDHVEEGHISLLASTAMRQPATRKMIWQALTEIKPHIWGSSLRNGNLDIPGSVPSGSLLFIRAWTALAANR